MSGAEGAVVGTGRPGAADVALFARIADGDSDAFAELYREYFHELYDFAARITRDREAAADIVQSVFTSVWERTQKGEHVRSPRAWLYRVTHNAAIDEIRRRGRTTRPDGDDGFDFAEVEDIRSRDPARVVIDKELAELVWSTAASLSPDEYALLDLNVRRDLSRAELADELGITTGALYTRLSRLRRSFEDALSVTLLRRRGGEECEEFADLIGELGTRVDTPEGNKLLQAHIRDCPTCQQSRRRYVTGAEVLAGIAPIPLIPGVQDAIASSLGGVLGLGGQAGAAGTPTSVAQPPTGSSASNMRIVRAARAHPLRASAFGVAAAAALAVGVWMAGATLLGTSSTTTARDPSLVWSPTHPGERSAKNHIKILWSRQPSALSYSVLWSHAPKDEPDTVPDLPGSATDTMSPALAPGRWYFHMRTQGQDHSWTDTVHLGPFIILPRSRAQPPSSGSAPAASTAQPRSSGSAPAGSTAQPRPSASAPAGSTSQPDTSGGGTPVPAGGGSAAPGGSSPRDSTTPSPARPRDSTPPSGQTVQLAGGPYYRSPAVALVLRHGVDRASGVDPATGLVQRLTGVLTQGTCGRWSGTWRAVDLQRSQDSTVADGYCYRYRYSIADLAGNRSAFSPLSDVAIVDTVPPSLPALSLSANDANTFIRGETIFFRADGSGSFSVTATSHDSGSGVAAIEFPALSHAGAPVRRTEAPYKAVYSWSRGTVIDGSKVVVSRDRAGNTTSARFTMAADGDAPTGMSVMLLGGASYPGGAVPLRVDEGSDAGSGVDRGSVTLERDSAALTSAGCGSYTGVWTPLSLPGSADTTVVAGHCYRYRVSVSDNVGNRASSPPSPDAKVGQTPPDR